MCEGNKKIFSARLNKSLADFHFYQKMLDN